MIRFTVFIPSLLMSGNIPDINIATDHETVDFRLTVYGAVLLEGRYYAFDGYAAVSDIAPLIEHYIADNAKMNFVDVLLEASDGDERIIVSYSEQRAAKDRHNRDKGIQRLRKAYSSGKINKKNVNQRGYNKFLVIENDVMVSIDEDKIAADAQWDGLKSYITNTDLAAGEVIDQYHGLWVVERAFRITKGSLEARPIFHFTERRIEAHICICFVAYKLYKELPDFVIAYPKNHLQIKGQCVDAVS